MRPIPPIHDLLPQKGAMCLLERLLSAAEDGAVAEAVVSQRWPTCTDGGVDPSLAVELIAQAAAAWFALRDEAQAPEPGLLVGVSGGRLWERRIRPGDVLHIEVREVWKKEALCQIAGRVMLDGVEIATAEVQVLRGQAALGALSAEAENEEQ